MPTNYSLGSLTIITKTLTLLHNPLIHIIHSTVHLCGFYVSNFLSYLKSWKLTNTLPVLPGTVCNDNQQLTSNVCSLLTVLTSRKLFSKATRMLVSILVLFFRLRLIPSMPMPGEPRALGLDRPWSDVRFSAQTASTQRKGREVKTRYCKDRQAMPMLLPWWQSLR